MADLSPYEQNAHREIDLFKNPPRSWLGDAWETVNKPIQWVGDVAFDNPVGTAVTKAVAGIVSTLNDGASWSVRADAIYEEFRANGHAGVQRASDLHHLDMGDVDKTVGYLAAKYKVMAGGEGAAAGMLGFPGIAIDIPALVSLALRAVNEYATYYGFDVALEHERAFAMSILGAASSPTVATKQVAMAELTKLSVLIAQRKTWAELQRLISVQVIKKIAQALGIRLTKAKLAQIVPLVGAGVGAGFNAWYVANVTVTAYHLYRERFLIEKYGPDLSIPVRST
ncbi:EcsC family protein [Sorangium atrum]|uniref:EcsC family protein n=1 Tax=Sorangium atrum TaxID=2995308 RepID=A0ABT5C9L8_9BACT|nr:EcsC family protein [Sorangium aterium]MDC0683126.1 EcsC family protein [Sorangium aterium]